jgi:hypothetical protein
MPIRRHGPYDITRDCSSTVTARTWRSDAGWDARPLYNMGAAAPSLHPHRDGSSYAGFSTPHSPKWKAPGLGDPSLLREKVAPREPRQKVESYARESWLEEEKETRGPVAASMRYQGEESCWSGALQLPESSKAREWRDTLPGLAEPLPDPGR